MSDLDKKKYDVVVVGGGAAGLMAAATAGKNGKNVVLIEHTSKIGEKIRISGVGGVILLIYTRLPRIIFAKIDILLNRL